MYARTHVYIFIYKVYTYSCVTCGHEILYKRIHVYNVIMNTMSNCLHEYNFYLTFISFTFIEIHQITVIW